MLNKGEKTGTSHASSQKERARVTTSRLFTWFIHFIIARGNVTIDHIDILLIGHTKLRHRPQDISELAMSVTKNHNPTSQITLSYALLKCHSVIPFKTGKRKKISPESLGKAGRSILNLRKEWKLRDWGYRSLMVIGGNSKFWFGKYQSCFILTPTYTVVVQKHLTCNNTKQPAKSYQDHTMIQK